jgi:APA family basic amino acid/polyamine antiporter
LRGAIDPPQQGSPCASEPAIPGDEGLVRALGVGSATLFVVGSVIGSGIFLTTGLMAEVLPSAGLILLAWTAGGLLALAGGLSYAELGTMFPRSGGVYVFLAHAYGPLVAFLYGWTALLVVIGGGIAAVSVGFAHYLGYFVPVLSPERALVTFGIAGSSIVLSGGQLAAVTAIVVLGAINYRGVRLGNQVNVVLTAAKIGGLAAIPVLALVFPRVDLDLLAGLPADVTRPVAAFGVAMIAVFWAYEAWYFVTYAGGEIRDPGRTLPLALVSGVLVLIVIYVSVNVAYFAALPIDRIRGVTRIGERAASALVGGWGATFVSLTVLVSTLGATAAALLAGPRLLFAMAEDGFFFRSAARVHPRFRTPHVAVGLLTVWSALLALSGSYEQLFTYVAFGSVSFSVAGGLALFRLRRLLPAHPRPYRTWGYPFVPAVFVAGCSAFVVNTLAERPWESLAGIGLMALGLPAYAWWRSLGAAQTCAPPRSSAPQVAPEIRDAP